MTGGRLHSLKSGLYFILTVVLVLLLATSTDAQKKQDKAQLQKEKQRSIARIRETEKILKETAQKKKNSIGELAAVTERIREQESLVQTIREEMSALDQDLLENHSILNTLSEDLNNLRAEYGKMVFSAQRARQSTDQLTFLFASSSFHQFMMRLRYMEQYGRLRQEQAKAIQQVSRQLESQILVTDSLRTGKNRLLQEELQENDRLSSLRKQQKQLVQSLEKQEKQLRKDLEETRKAVARLDKLISDLVKEEMARETSKRESRTAPVALSASFEGNKNKFGWPANGFISQRFGRQRHPVLTKVETWNDGINIQTREGETVNAVFAGEVRRVAFIPGIGTSVIIKHGDYFTVYAGLKDVSVKTGQNVEAGQSIGIVLSNGEGKAELRFQIRKNTVALNPEEWLRN